MPSPHSRLPPSPPAGLHDLANYGPALPPTPLPQYGDNLRTIYNILSKHAKLVMWTSTTPCPNVTTSYDRSYDKVVAYNARAVEALQPLAKTWLINDLFSDFIKVGGGLTLLSVILILLLVPLFWPL